MITMVDNISKRTKQNTTLKLGMGKQGDDQKVDKMSNDNDKS
jgi:hypothetical protein